MTQMCTRCQILVLLAQDGRALTPSLVARKLKLPTPRIQVAMLKMSRQGKLRRFPPPKGAKQGFTYAARAA